MSRYAVRFSPKQRVEHVLVMVTFVLLAVTGFPQKFFEMGVSRAIVSWFGGLDRLRFVHRFSGIVFTLLTAEHVMTAVWLALARRMKMTLLPTKQDFHDAILQLRYDLGLSEKHPKFDHWDYRQKFEYWGLVLGGLVMIATGLVLYLPMLVTRFLPGELIPVAKVAHSNEGLMAFLVVITWHIFNAHLAPGIFPYDASIFTGKISMERLKHEHALEYDRLAGASEPPAASPPPAEEPGPSPTGRGPADV